jgi:hypothetical protein
MSMRLHRRGFAVYQGYPKAVAGGVAGGERRRYSYEPAAAGEARRLEDDARLCRGATHGPGCFYLQGTLDTPLEDLLVTPVIEGAGKLRYVASPLVTAMILGGIAILDEGNRMSEKSWASLAPLLDSQRYVESIVAGIKINAHPNSGWWRP